MTTMTHGSATTTQRTLADVTAVPTDADFAERLRRALRNDHPESVTTTSSDHYSHGAATVSTSTSGDAAIRKVADQITGAMRPIMPNQIRVSGLSKWHGRILEVAGGIFTAELVGEDSHLPLHADFATELLGESDVAPGDLVYVTSRTVAGPSGYPTLTSAVRLRRLGPWTADDVSRHGDASEKAWNDVAELFE